MLEVLFSLFEAHESLISKLQAQATAREQLEAEALRGAAAAQDDHASRTSQALQQLETRLEGQERAATEQHADLEGRLQRLELRLRGASNMAGRQAALDDIASMLGVAVPEGVRCCAAGLSAPTSSMRMCCEDTTLCRLDARPPALPASCLLNSRRCLEARGVDRPPMPLQARANQAMA